MEQKDIVWLFVKQFLDTLYCGLFLSLLLEVAP